MRRRNRRIYNFLLDLNNKLISKRIGNRESDHKITIFIIMINNKLNRLQETEKILIEDFVAEL